MLRNSMIHLKWQKWKKKKIGSTKIGGTATVGIQTKKK